MADAELITDNGKSATLDFISHENKSGQGFSSAPKDEDGDVMINGISNKSEKEDGNQEVPEQKAEEEEEEEEWMDILGSGQLKKKIIKKGEDDSRPQRADICQIKYEGRLEDGTVVESDDCLTINIGDAEVIQGLDFAIPLMDVGEVSELIVGPRFAYGSCGREPDVPPDSTLFYTVTLISADAEPEIAALSIKERKSIGNRKKERGNWWYSRSENTLAIQCYRRALDYLDDIENSPDNVDDNKLNEEEIHNLLEDRIKVYNNLAAAQMKIKAFDTALQSVENVLMCQPRNVKALFRKGKILAEKGDIEKSLSSFRQALSVDPSSESVKKEFDRISMLQKKNTALERNLYKKMLGTNEEKPRSPKTEKNNTVTWCILASSLAAVVFGAVAIRYKFL